VAKLILEGDVRLCDGELVRDRHGLDTLVNTVVGLFPVTTTNKAAWLDHAEAIPPIFFYDGKRYKGSRKALHDIVSRKFVPRMEKVMGYWKRSEWDKTEPKYGFCPVTKNIIRRVDKQWSSQRVARDRSDVFVCFAHEDLSLARRVTEYIIAQTGRSGFFSPQSDLANFGRAIDDSLKSADILVAVASSPRHLEKRWPEFEYRMFHIMAMNGRKSRDAIMSYIQGFHPADLPMPLPYYHSVEHDPANPDQSLSKLLPFIARVTSQ